MRSEWLCAGLCASLLVLSAGCGGGDASATTKRLSHTSHLPVDLPEPTQFDPSRNFVAEYEDFERLVGDRADPDRVGAALGVPPSEQSEYKTMDGVEMRSFEYKLQGPRKDAPFFEAFAAGYPNQSFYVFFEKGWFGWKAIDCGFHVSGVLGPLAAAD